MNIKKITVAILVILAIAFGAIQLKRARDYRAYAEKHNCTWFETGSHYGDNRDWKCEKDR